MWHIYLAEFNKELLQKLNETGIRQEDYKYCDLYRDYLKLSETMKSRKEVILTLADRHHISDRQVYNILHHLEMTVKRRHWSNCFTDEPQASGDILSFAL